MMALGLILEALAQASTCRAAATANASSSWEGMAGLATAYELGKKGYDCTLLEARNRPGGRVWTVRKGTKETETRTEQTCTFDEGQFFNAGAMRIPHHHESVIAYCRELGVPLESSTIPTKELTTTATAVPARWPASASGSGNCTAICAATPLNCWPKLSTSRRWTCPSPEDREKIIGYLVAEGSLDATRLYKGSSRRGYSVVPGAYDQPGKMADAPALLHLIEAGYLSPHFYNVPEYTYEQQTTMLMVPGGTDRLTDAFVKKIGKRSFTEPQ